MATWNTSNLTLRTTNSNLPSSGASHNTSSSNIQSNSQELGVFLPRLVVAPSTSALFQDETKLHEERLTNIRRNASLKPIKKEELIPIRLNIPLDKYYLQDHFTWNVYGKKK